MVNTTFNNISIVSWQSGLVKETTDLRQATYKLYHIMLYQIPRHERDSNSQH